MSDYRHQHFCPQQQAPSSQSDHIYLTRYKELKRKVKETELDNDRLHLKVLKIRKNIQRLRLERAILYERLEALHASNSVSFPSDPLPQHRPAIQSPPRHGKCPEADVEKERPPQNAIHLRHQNASPSSLNTPQRHPQHAEFILHAGQSQTHKPSESRPVATLPVKLQSSVRSPDRPRTFPFVLEYAHTPATSAPTTEYPTEVRFYPYESSAHHRSQSNSEQAKRPPERELKFRHHFPETTTTQSLTRSPKVTRESCHPPSHPFLPSDEQKLIGESGCNSRHSHEADLQAGRSQAVKTSQNTKECELNERWHDDFPRQQDRARKVPLAGRGSISQAEAWRMGEMRPSV